MQHHLDIGNVPQCTYILSQRSGMMSNFYLLMMMYDYDLLLVTSVDVKPAANLYQSYVGPYSCVAVAVYTSIYIHTCITHTTL